jgi:hypothetical protein
MVYLPQMKDALPQTSKHPEAAVKKIEARRSRASITFERWNQ